MREYIKEYTQKEVNALLARCAVVGYERLSWETRCRVNDIMNQDYDLIDEEKRRDKKGV